MKKVRQLLSMLAAFVMVIGLSITGVFAQNTANGSGSTANDDKGSITVTNTQKDQEYKLYKMLNLESFDAASGAYSYTVANGWDDFFTDGAGKDFVKIENGYVTWKLDESSKVVDAARLAKAALAYVNENTLDATKTAIADGTPLTFRDLELGYYLLDTTTGTVCSITNTDLNRDVEDKNPVPTLDKEVKEGENWGNKNDANVGDTVEFKITVHAKKGAERYIVHDDLSNGLTLNTGSIKVYKESISDANLVANTNYTVKTRIDEEVNHDSCDLEIEFEQDFLDEITTDTDLIITYSAVLNDGAVVAGSGNDNEAKLEYSQKPGTFTTEKKTKTYTWEFEVIKYTGSLTDKTFLAGAEFELRTVADDASTALNFKTKAGEENTYLYAKEAEENVTTTKITTTDTGIFNLEGLDAGTYYLVETKAPAGYNILANAITVVIDRTESTDTKTYTQTLTATGAGSDSSKVSVTGDDINVLNTTGSQLPETGGMGTTYLYVIGGLLVAGSAVLMIARKRMSAE